MAPAPIRRVTFMIHTQPLLFGCHLNIITSRSIASRQIEGASLPMTSQIFCDIERGTVPQSLGQSSDHKYYYTEAAVCTIVRDLMRLLICFSSDYLPVLYCMTSFFFVLPLHFGQASNIAKKTNALCCVQLLKYASSIIY